MTLTLPVFAALEAPLQTMLVHLMTINSLTGTSGGLTSTVPRVFPKSRASCLHVSRHLWPRAVTE